MHISTTNLGKQFGRTQALSEVSIEIVRGEIIAVVGENGAGKTTLLQMLAGILAPSSGEIRYDDEVFHRGKLHLRKRFFYLPDSAPVFTQMTPIRHISMVAKLYEQNDCSLAEVAHNLLRDFQILPLVDSPIYSLSRGEHYKAALVPLIAVNPELWILDEPFAAGMDPKGIAAFRRHARNAADQGRTVIYSTQLLDIAARFSHRICVLNRGSVAGFGTLDELQLQADTSPALREMLEAIGDY